MLTPGLRPFPPLAEGFLRVRMSFAPVNPSDMIPITGAYAHRIPLPSVAGYEGVGEVVAGQGLPPGTRVLPLRGGGTWAEYVDVPAARAVPVPGDIDDILAARGYINPVAARLMLDRWRPRGKRVLITAAGSACAGLIAQWALSGGAAGVTGIVRPDSTAPLAAACGARIVTSDHASEVARSADLTFDAVGGDLADAIVAAMPAGGRFVSYGLLSGRPIRQWSMPVVPERFHIRDYLPGLDNSAWQGLFHRLWPILRATSLPPVRCYPFDEWCAAITEFGRPGRAAKPILILR